jgi:hypothetical protein
MTSLSLALLASLILNAVLIWYARKLTKQFVFFGENTENLKEALDAFGTHVNSLHELEMFYGDETLGALIKHAKHVVEVVEDFHESFTLELEGEEEEEIDGDT